jgi:hypothetical protein
MKKNLSHALISLAALFFVSTSAHAANYQLRILDNSKSISSGKPINIKYRVNDFYSVYYIYMNVIRAMEMEKHLSGKEITQVINSMIDQLKQRKAAQLIVYGYPGVEDLRVTLRTDYTKNDHRPILWLVSNYDPRSKRAVVANAHTDVYATYFYLANDKLVKYQYVTNAKTKKAKAAKSVNNLADFFLLDAKTNNDASGKKLLLNGIKKSKVPLERFIMHLTLSEYYLLENNTGKARKELDIARKMIQSEKNSRTKQSMKNIFTYAEDVYSYFVSYRKS